MARIISAPRTKVAAKNRIEDAVPPVSATAQPTIAGPKKPDRLAKELIIARPAAADTPLSSAVGRFQNSGGSDHANS